MNTLQNLIVWLCSLLVDEVGELEISMQALIYVVLSNCKALQSIA